MQQPDITPAASTSRIRVAEVACMLGIGVRCVQQMAATGRLPGAARIGKLWTFDPAKIRAYLADAEARCQNQISIRGMEFGGCVLPLPDANPRKLTSPRYQSCSAAQRRKA